MNTTPMLLPEVASDVEAYAAIVRSALVDLSPAQRELLIEDLEEHLAEIAAEVDGPLAERLGDPLAYAAELRASAGFAVGAPPRHGRLATWAGRRRAQARAQLEAQRGWAPTVAFLRTLRPAWVLLRGYLAVMLFSAAVNDNNQYGFLPHLTSHLAGFTGLVTVVVAVYGSLRLDRLERSGLRRAGRVAVLAASGVLVLFGADRMLLIQSLDQADASYSYAEPAPVATPSQGAQPGGQPTSDLTAITNIYAYGADGQPLDNVRLYDQVGHPIVLADPWFGDPSVLRTHVLQTDGQLSDNAYPIRRELAPGQPQDQYKFDEAGALIEFGSTPAAVVPPLLVPTPAPTASLPPAPRP